MSTKLDADNDTTAQPDPTVPHFPNKELIVHQLCKCLQKPTPELIEDADCVLAYLYRHSSVGLTYTKEQAALAGYADASWEVRNSTSGWVVLWQSAALTWGSRKQKSGRSPSELRPPARGGDHRALRSGQGHGHLRKLTRGLGEPEPGPSPLSTDSQSARDVSYNPEHHDRMKHVQRRHFFVRDMVETFELEVPFVRTVDNIADFFTKPMKSATLSSVGTKGTVSSKDSIMSRTKKWRRCTCFMRSWCSGL